MTIARLRGAVAATLAALLAWSPSARAQAPRPSWECLPEDTAAMVRLPEPASFLEMMRARTKLGAVGLSADRIDSARKLLVGKIGADGAGTDDDWELGLRKYNLSAADLEAACRGDTGAALVVRPMAGDSQPLVMLLAWMEPGIEVAERLIGAAKQRLEEAADDEAAPARRIDLEMAGYEVIWAVEPVMGIDRAALGLENGTDGTDPTPEEIARRLAEARERLRDATPVRIGTTHAFITRIDGRVVVGQTAPQGTSPSGGGAADGGGEERGAERARELFERFLAAHRGGDDGHLPGIIRAAGVRDAAPDGMPLADVVIDPRVLTAALGSDPAAARLASLGLDRLGPIVIRQAFDDGRWRSTAFVTLPEPRHGLARILDQECDPSEVPSFVTSEAIDLTQISLDLGAAYRTIREFAVEQNGEQAANLFTAVEMQAQGWLGVDLPGLLSSLGTRHWIVTYPSQIAEALEEGRRRARLAPQPVDVAVPIAADRAAVVWQVADEAPFFKILERLAAAAGTQVVEEQGFRGVRLPAGPAAFVGRNHLVLAIGADSLERTLAAIRNPPTGGASLREGGLIARARELAPLEPARLFGVSDSTRSGGTLGTLRDFAAALRPEDVAEAYRGILSELQGILPTTAEMEGMVGVGVTLLRAGPEGLTLESVWEMPSP